jgi:hypothetical protein
MPKCTPRLPSLSPRGTEGSMRFESFSRAAGLVERAARGAIAAAR